MTVPEKSELEKRPEKGSPEYYRRMARLLLILSPAMFIMCYALAAIQGAEPRHSLLISAVGTAGCLGAALLIYLRGAKAGSDAVWIRLILAALARK